MNAAARDPASGRSNMIKTIKIAQREMGIEDDVYREILKRLTGKTSSTECTPAQLGLVLDEFRAKGWGKPRVFVSENDKQVGSTPSQRVANNKFRRRPADTPIAKKARAMWISLYQLGAVRNASEQALEAFACRQLHVEAMQWADQGLGYKLIEALKAMAERAGWSQDLARVQPQHQVETLKRRLVERMQVKLGLPYCQVPAAELDMVIAQLGHDIREARQ